MHRCFSLAFLLGSIAICNADDKAVAKQKAAIEANLKEVKAKPGPVVESADLLIISTLPEAKTKAMADAAQKAVATARANMQYGKDEPPFPGKLAVYAFADSAEFKSFIRKVEQKQPGQEMLFTMNLRGDTPYLVLGPEPGSKSADIDLIPRTASLAAAAVLNRKLGAAPDTTLPDWILIGYGRACLLRSEPAAKQSTARAKIKTLVNVKSKAPPTVKDLWMSKSMRDRDLIAGSVVEYLAFVAHEDKFLSFARLARGTEDDDKQVVLAAIQSLEHSADSLDMAWKTWVIKGK